MIIDITYIIYGEKKEMFKKQCCCSLTRKIYIHLIKCSTMARDYGSYLL